MTPTADLRGKEYVGASDLATGVHHISESSHSDLAIFPMLRTSRQIWVQAFVRSTGTTALMAAKLSVLGICELVNGRAATNTRHGL